MRQELQVDQAARDQLQIERALGRLVAVEPRPHVGHVAAGRGLVAGLAENVADGVADLVAELRIAGDRPRPGQRHALPGPGVGRLVAAEGIDARRQRPHVARRAQAEIDLVQDALAHLHGQRRDQPLGQPGEIQPRGERLVAVRFLDIRVVVVEQDQVDVGAGGQLAIAQPPHAEQRQPRAGHPAMLLGKGIADRLQRGVQHHIGDVGEGRPRLAHIDHAAEEARTDEETLFGGKDPQPRQNVLVAVRLRQEAGQPLLHHRALGHLVEEGRVEQRVEDMRARRDGLAQRRGRGDDQRQKVEDARVGGDQREELDARRQPRQKRVEGGDRPVRVLGVGKGRQQHRQARGQTLARRLRPRRAIAAEAPAAHDPRDVLRPGKAQLLQPRQRVGIVLAGQEPLGDRLLALSRIALAAVVEQARIVPVHPAQMRQQCLGEGLAIGKAGQPGNALQPFLVLRQRVALLVGDHLDAVLDPPQEPVILEEVAGRIGGDPAPLGQFVQRLVGAPAAQLRCASAGDELLGLDEELDLANAAPPELHIVTADGDVVEAAMAIDTGLHRLDVGDRREVEIFAPDEGRQLLEERLARRPVARDGAGLDHGGALPVAPRALVIAHRRIGGDRQRHRARVGPQPQIGAEDIAVGGPFADDPHQPPHDAREGVDRFGRIGGDRLLGIEEHDQVDIAGIVQFARAQLAHAEDEQAASGLRVGRVGQHDLAALVGRDQAEAQRRGDRRFGKLRQVLGGLLDARRAEQVAQRDQQRDLALDQADRRHQRRLALFRHVHVAQFADPLRDPLAGRRVEQRVQPFGVLEHLGVEIGREVEHRAEPRHVRAAPREKFAEPRQILRRRRLAQVSEPRLRLAGIERRRGDVAADAQIAVMLLRRVLFRHRRPSFHPEETPGPL